MTQGVPGRRRFAQKYDPKCRKFCAICHLFKYPTPCYNIIVKRGTEGRELPKKNFRKTLDTQYLSWYNKYVR